MPSPLDPVPNASRRRIGNRHALLRGGGAAVMTLVLTLLGDHTSHAQNQRETERKLEQLHAELQHIAEDRHKLESQRGQAARQLRQADEKVAKSARLLDATETALRDQERALEKLQQQRAQMRQGLHAQRTQLAALLRAAYQLGSNAPLKLLLSQDSIADINRSLTYHRYVQNQRAQQIQALTAQLVALNRVEQDILTRRQALAATRQQQKTQTTALQKNRAQQQVTITELDSRYQQGAEREKALGQDAKSLERLLANLRAAARRAEAERQAAARRAAAAAAQAKHETFERAGKSPPKSMASASGPKVGGFSWPVAGSLLARFGGKLPDGRTSTGVLIGAAKGSTVNAVADGTVVFSEWMTGYGMILIIDHGNGYMSLYAHNDTLLRDAGAAVKHGEAVAKVGSSGGQGVSALYFELRRNGQPVDPSTWLERH